MVRRLGVVVFVLSLAAGAWARDGVPRVGEDGAATAWLAARRAACVDVTPAQVQERFVFLDQAIRAGNRDAMMDYRFEGPLGFDIATLDPADPRLVAWKRNANGYLETLAVGGNRQAWSTLSLDYELGIVVERDTRASILYETAVIATSRRPDRDPSTLDFVAAMATTMRADDVRDAVAAGRALAARFPDARDRGLNGP